MPDSHTQFCSDLMTGQIVCLTGEVMLGVDATNYPVRCIHP